MVLILASKLPRSEKEWVFVLFASYASMQDYIYCIFLLFHWSVLSSGNTKRWITLSSLFQGKTFWHIKVGEACGSIQAKKNKFAGWVPNNCLSFWVLVLCTRARWAQSLSIITTGLKKCFKVRSDVYDAQNVFWWEVVNINII